MERRPDKYPYDPTTQQLAKREVDAHKDTYFAIFDWEYCLYMHDADKAEAAKVRLIAAIEEQHRRGRILVEHLAPLDRR